MRTRFTVAEAGFSRTSFASGFGDIARKFAIEWQVHDTAVLPRVLIMVSRYDHCLNDLLYRYRTGALKMAIPAIISNHMDLAGLASWHKVPYFHIPVSAATRQDAEARLMDIAGDTQAELIVLARYMQILSPAMCTQLRGTHHQHPPLLPARLQGRQALSRSTPARREADRRHGALCDGRPG
jgi:formyltetrahydrofolate deformylase